MKVDVHSKQFSSNIEDISVIDDAASNQFGGGTNIHSSTINQLLIPKAKKDRLQSAKIQSMNRGDGTF